MKHNAPRPKRLAGGRPLEKRGRPRSRTMTAVWFLRSPGNYPQRRVRMDKQTVALVQESWANVVPISTTAGALFVSGASSPS
jgi:hypothetical protein